MLASASALTLPRALRAMLMPCCCLRALCCLRLTLLPPLLIRAMMPATLIVAMPPLALRRAPSRQMLTPLSFVALRCRHVATYDMLAATPYAPCLMFATSILRCRRYADAAAAYYYRFSDDAASFILMLLLYRVMLAQMPRATPLR